MPLSNGGGDINIARNINTGLYDWVWDGTGNPEFTDTGIHAVMSVLLEFRGKWWADLTGRRGSNLTLIQNLLNRTPSQAKAYAEEALQPLLDSGYLESFSCSAARAGSRLLLTVQFSRPGQSPQVTRLPLSW